MNIKKKDFYIFYAFATESSIFGKTNSKNKKMNFKHQIWNKPIALSYLINSSRTLT